MGMGQVRGIAYFLLNLEQPGLVEDLVDDLLVLEGFNDQCVQLLGAGLDRGV